MKPNRTSNGFTLVELAIVLVIIGLLVGGVLAGQELVNQAKIRKAITQIGQYKLASETFRAKYGQLPGDLTKATAYFPECKGGNSGVITCNGNGDGRIMDYQPGLNTPGSFEGYFAWRHLTLSGILEGDYNINDGDGQLERGKDMPIFLLPSASPFYIFFYFASPGDEQLFYGLQGQLIFFAYADGGINISDCDVIRDLDSKIDDGRYNSGIMRPNTEEGDDCSDINSLDGSYKHNTSGNLTFVIKY